MRGLEINWPTLFWMAAVASTSYLWVYLAYSWVQNAFTTESEIFSITFARYSTSESMRLMPRSVDPGYSNSARIALFKMYSMRADHTSGHTFLNTDISPEATKWRCSGSTRSITLNAMG